MTKHKTGYITADTRQSRVLMGTLAAEARRNRSPIGAAMSVARGMEFATVVARRKARDNPLSKAWGRVGKASRFGSKKRHA